MAQMPPDADATAAALLSMGGLQSTVQPVSYYDPNTSCWTTGNFDQHTLQPCRSPAEELKMCQTLPLPLPPSPCGPPFAATVCNMGVHTVSPLLQTFSPLPRTSQPGTAQVQCGAACGAMPAVNGHTPCFSDAHASSMVRMHGQALFNMSRPHLPQHLPPQASPAQPAQASATPSERVHTTPPCGTHPSPPAQQFSRHNTAPSTYSSHCTSFSSGFGTARVGGIPGPTYRSMSKLLDSDPKLLHLHSEADQVGFPRGPIEGTDETLEEKVRQWATNPKTANGSHALLWDPEGWSGRAAIRKKGQTDSLSVQQDERKTEHLQVGMHFRRNC